jgi:phosphoglycerol transferase
MACTLKDMVSFLDHVARSRGDRSTVVLLLSDHLNHDPAMGARFNDGNRQNTVIMYGLGLDSPLAPAGTLIDKPGSMPDVFPTLLAFSGLAGRDAMAGLGRSLFSDRPTIVEEKGIGRYNAELFPNPLLKTAIWDTAPE